jgi:hypothetical protein
MVSQAENERLLTVKSDKCCDFVELGRDVAVRHRLIGNRSHNSGFVRKEPPLAQPDAYAAVAIRHGRYDVLQFGT